MVNSFLFYAQEAVYFGTENIVFEVIYKGELKTFTDTLTIQLTSKEKNNGDKSERIMLYQFRQNNVYRGVQGSTAQAIDSTTYIDRKEEFIMRPPLHRYYHILEVAPLPCVLFPLYPNKIYSYKTYLGNNWGAWAGSKVTSSYRVVHNTSVTWVIESEAIVAADQSFSNKLHILFNKREGFLELFYEFADGTTIEFNQL